MEDSQLNDLHIRASKGDIEARNRLVEHHQPLVISAVQRLNIRSMDKFQDLIQEGTLGLFEALERFDPTRGIKFSTYAYLWIQKYIGAGIDSCDNIIWIPQQPRRAIAMAKRIGGDEGIDAAATKHKISPAFLRQVMGVAGPAISTADLPYEGISGERPESIDAMHLRMIVSDCVDEMDGEELETLEYLMGVPGHIEINTKVKKGKDRVARAKAMLIAKVKKRILASDVSEPACGETEFTD